MLVKASVTWMIRSKYSWRNKVRTVFDYTKRIMLCSSLYHISNVITILLQRVNRGITARQFI